jgi:hypothetical protein
MRLKQTFSVKNETPENNLMTYPAAPQKPAGSSTSCEVSRVQKSESRIQNDKKNNYLIFLIPFYKPNFEELTRKN